MKDFDVFIAQDEATYRYLMNNANFESYIKVVKVDAESGKNIPYAGAGFEIYDPAGNKISMTFTYPTPTTIDVFYTNADGELVTPEMLPYGEGYSLVEVQAPYGYVIDRTPVYFDVAQDNSTEESGVTVIKVNKENMAQKGVIIVEKTGEVFWGVNVSGDEDSETLYQPVYQVTVNEDEQVIEITVTDEFVRGNISLTKVDKDFPDNKLSGAVFEVYKDLNGDGKLDDGDELLGELEEADKGIYEMKELLYGKYLVKETKAPEGFVLDEGVYSVFIEENGKTYQVENEAGVGFINDAMRGSLKIVKTSSDGKVEGFSFRVTGENGYDKTFVTDAKGEILIENLRIGEYTISEVSDKASANYVLPANKDATVKVGSTTVVTMHNELRDTPKTGDNSHLGLWFTLAGLSALGIAATTFVALKKKKKEDAE